MAKFIYTAHVPSLQKDVGLTELTFTNYKQLVKLIHNDDNTRIIKIFNDLITSCYTEPPSKLTFLDKLILLLTIRAVCVYPVLEFVYKQPQSGTEYSLKFEISNIIDKLIDHNFYKTYNNVCYSYNGYEITYGIPEELYYSSEEELILSTIKKISIKSNKLSTTITEITPEILERLPLNVYKDAKKHIKAVEDAISKITLLSITVSDNKSENVDLSPSIFNNSALEFLKLAYKRDLISLYELEYFLATKLNLPYNIIDSSTYAELMIYIGFYTDETKRRESEENKNKVFNPLTPNR